MKKSDMFWQTYLNLEKEVLEASKYIYFTDYRPINRGGCIVTESYNFQLETFSPHIADLLVRCCTQIEAISKELYFDNGGSKIRGDTSIYFDEDCLKLADIKWNTSKKIVMVTASSFGFAKDENLFLRPLKNAHKRQGTHWEKSYQAVKHDGYASMYKGNIKALLQALAALYLLNIYSRNDSWKVKYQDLPNIDYSLGSAIFAVKPPVVSQLWYGNNPTISASPYVVEYDENDYQRIEEMQQQDNEMLKNFLGHQPEMQEPSFLNTIQGMIDSNPAGSVLVLAKYRFYKKISPSLTFFEKKKLLTDSKEWNSRTHQKAKHFSMDELTEMNIDEEIDNTALHMGLDILNREQKLEWVSFAKTCAKCVIHIK